MTIVIGVDAHRRTHTLVAVDPLGRKVAQKCFATNSQAHAEAVRWVRAQLGTDVVWGVVDCRSLTARLERDLLAAGHRVVRVPPRLMSRSRASSREQGKSDPIDALAVARVVLREPELPVACHNQQSMELRLLVDRREDLIRQRVTTINRMLDRVHQLDPAWAMPRDWASQKARAALGDWLATQEGLLAELARDEFDEMVRLGDAAQVLASRIGERVRSVAPALLALTGCGELTAAKIVAEVAGVERFKSEAAFARYIGMAPIPNWSGDARTMCTGRHGNRQLNAAIHRIALGQITHDGPGKTYYQRRLAEGDTRQRALRALKRRLARVVFNKMKTCVPAPDRSSTNGHALPAVFLLPHADLAKAGNGDSPAPEARRARGQQVGRPKVLDSDKAALARRMHASGEPVKTIAETLGVSAATVYRIVAEG